MTDPTMAMTSDVAIWAAIAVLALALVAFSVHLAIAGASSERRADARSRDEVLVPAGGDPAPTRSGLPDRTDPAAASPAASASPPVPSTTSACIAICWQAGSTITC